MQTHPNYEFRRSLSGLLGKLDDLNKVTYDRFEKNPSQFSKHQQDILLNDLEVNDNGVGWKKLSK